MTEALKAFMAAMIDYAGLFPPAGLGMAESVRNYLEYRQSPERWMLGRFLCPVGRLDELSGRLREHVEPLSLSVILTPVAATEEYLARLEKDARVLREFLRRQTGAVQLQMIETRAPAEVIAIGEAGAVEAFLDYTAEILKAAGLPPVPVFHEVGFPADWRQSTAAYIEGLGQYNAGREELRFIPAGFKMRCGGLEPSDFPEAEQVAFAVGQCRDAAVPMKATAGLHHPVRGRDPKLNVATHGFLNVFGAILLSGKHSLDETLVREILEEDNPASFRFIENSFAWKEWQVDVDEIRELREALGVSFGSCSFDEPRDDLRDLGLL
ncbi:MAG: hypothetical protein GF355_05410 [Candidatus Eisenbacteria bacterium]|nr:hypothetical protein [Candidatus Eisenbacteria bacterium]